MRTSFNHLAEGVAAAIEAATGLALMIAPAVVARLLLGTDLSGAGPAVGRVAGCALVALGIACWPGRDQAGMLISAARAMLTYNALVACYLGFLGIGGKLVSADEQAALDRIDSALS